MHGKFDAKNKALDELMAYLDQKDGEELGAAVKPPEPEIEVEAEASPGGEEAAVVEAEGASPEMSEEELQQLIEALQAAGEA